MNYLSFAVLAVATATPAAADLTVRFYEGAPTDKFEIIYSGACQLTDVVVEIDLGASEAGLILDVTGKGAGVNVYQPLAIVDGAALLEAIPLLEDGDTVISLPVSALDTGDKISFTLDVDDTKGSGPTMISGAEITGAQISVESAQGKESAAFDETAIARLGIALCNA